MNYVIVIAHQKGGVGKTTISINIAVTLAQKLNVKIIDFDVQKQFTKFNEKRKDKLNLLKINSKEELIKTIKDEKDALFIIDLGGYDSELSRTVLMLSDMIIIPASSSDNDLDGLVQFTNIIKEIQNKRGNDIHCNLLVNRIHHADTSTLRAFKNFTKDKAYLNCFDSTLFQKAIYTKMLSSGKAVTELTEPTDSANIQITQLTNEIETIIKGA